MSPDRPGFVDAVIPYLVLPTGTTLSTDRVEGGVSVPFAWSFAEHFALDAWAPRGRG